MDIDAQKKQIRKQISQKKKCLTINQKIACEKEVFDIIECLPEFKISKHILCYWSLPDELPTHRFIEKWYQSKQFYLPKVVGDELEIISYSGKKSMVIGKYNIKEPRGEAIIDFSVIDIVIVPGVAFSKYNERLGRGGGYYDRLLPKTTNAVKIGIGYLFQILSDLPSKNHDILMDKVVSGQSC